MKVVSTENGQSKATPNHLEASPKGTFCLEGPGFLEDFFLLPMISSTLLGNAARLGDICDSLENEEGKVQGGPRSLEDCFRHRFGSRDGVM